MPTVCPSHAGALSGRAAPEQPGTTAGAQSPSPRDVARADQGALLYKAALTHDATAAAAAGVGQAMGEGEPLSTAAPPDFVQEGDEEERPGGGWGQWFGDLVGRGQQRARQWWGAAWERGTAAGPEPAAAAAAGPEGAEGCAEGVKTRMWGLGERARAVLPIVMAVLVLAAAIFMIGGQISAAGRRAVILQALQGNVQSVGKSLQSLSSDLQEVKGSVLPRVQEQQLAQVSQAADLQDRLQSLQSKLVRLEQELSAFKSAAAAPSNTSTSTNSATTSDATTTAEATAGAEPVSHPLVFHPSDVLQALGGRLLPTTVSAHSATAFDSSFRARSFYFLHRMFHPLSSRPGVLPAARQLATPSSLQHLLQASHAGINSGAAGTRTGSVACPLLLRSSNLKGTRSRQLGWVEFEISTPVQAISAITLLLPAQLADLSKPAAGTVTAGRPAEMLQRFEVSLGFQKTGEQQQQRVQWVVADTFSAAPDGSTDADAATHSSAEAPKVGASTGASAHRAAGWLQGLGLRSRTVRIDQEGMVQQHRAAAMGEVITRVRITALAGSDDDQPGSTRGGADVCMPLVFLHAL